MGSGTSMIPSGGSVSSYIHTTLEPFGSEFCGNSFGRTVVKFDPASHRFSAVFQLVDDSSDDVLFSNNLPYGVSGLAYDPVNGYYFGTRDDEPVMVVIGKSGVAEIPFDLVQEAGRGGVTFMDSIGSPKYLATGNLAGELHLVNLDWDAVAPLSSVNFNYVHTGTPPDIYDIAVTAEGRFLAPLKIGSGVIIVEIFLNFDDNTFDYEPLTSVAGFDASVMAATVLDEDLVMAGEDGSWYSASLADILSLSDVITNFSIFRDEAFSSTIDIVCDAASCHSSSSASTSTTSTTVSDPSEPVCSGDILYLGSDGGKVYQYIDGEQDPLVIDLSYPGAGLAMDHSTGKTYVYSNNGHVTVIDVDGSTSTIVSNVPNTEVNLSLEIVITEAGDTVLIISNLGGFYAVTLSGDTVLSTVALSGNPAQISGMTRTSDGRLVGVSDVNGPDRTLYELVYDPVSETIVSTEIETFVGFDNNASISAIFEDEDGDLNVVDYVTGTVIQIVDGVVEVVSTTGYSNVMDFATCVHGSSSVSTSTTSTTVSDPSEPVCSGDILYLGLNGGKVYQYIDGEQDPLVTDLSYPGAGLAMDHSTGKTYVYSVDGNITVIDVDGSISVISSSIPDTHSNLSLVLTITEAGDSVLIVGNSDAYYAVTLSGDSTWSGVAQLSGGAEFVVDITRTSDGRLVGVSDVDDDGNATLYEFVYDPVNNTLVSTSIETFVGFDNNTSITAIFEDEDGDLNVVDYVTGNVIKLVDGVAEVVSSADFGYVMDFATCVPTTTTTTTVAETTKKSTSALLCEGGVVFLTQDGLNLVNASGTIITSFAEPADSIAMDPVTGSVLVVTSDSNYLSAVTVKGEVHSIYMDDSIASVTGATIARENDLFKLVVSSTSGVYYVGVDFRQLSTTGTLTRYSNNAVSDVVTDSMGTVFGADESVSGTGNLNLFELDLSVVVTSLSPAKTISGLSPNDAVKGMYIKEGVMYILTDASLYMVYQGVATPVGNPGDTRDTAICVYKPSCSCKCRPCALRSCVSRKCGCC